MIIPGFLSNLELTRLREPNFFPNRNEALETCDEICIGTKSRNLGDALILTRLPEVLKKRYPKLRIYTFPRAFNPVVFYGNPHVAGIRYLPKRVFGDDCSWEMGHLIQQKERFFGLSVDSDSEVRPQLFLQDSETARARKFLEREFKNIKTEGEAEKPLCVLHPSGATWKNLLPQEFWSSIIQRWSHRYHFLSLGMRGDVPIPGSTALFFSKKRPWEARRLFAVLSQAQLFVGIDSGPMHAARAFQIPSLIFVSGQDPEVMFENRQKFPYFLVGNRRYSALYQSNTHVRVDSRNSNQIQDAVDVFLDQP